MYSVLLVEDEKIELETLRDYINWKELSVDTVYTARNGRSAMECIVQNEPDIVITDIQMPIMSGIELAKRVREDGYKTKIVFLTGYDDFEYVKAAFKVQAVDYILKPFMAEEVEKLILRIEGQIDRERTAEVSLDAAARKMVEKVCRGNIKEEELNELSARFYGCPADRVSYGLLAVYGVNCEELLQRIEEGMAEVYHSFLMESMLTVVVSGHLYFHDAAKRMGNMLEGNYSIVYLEEKIPLTAMNEKVKLLKSLEDRIFYEKRGVILEGKVCEQEKQEFRGLNREHLHERRAELRKSIVAGEWEQAEKELEGFFAEWRRVRKEKCIREAYGLYCDFKCSLIMEDLQLEDWMEEGGNKWDQKLLEGQYFDDICRVITEFMGKMAAFFKKQHDAPNYYIIAWIKDYLEHNYSGFCSVEEMAEKVHLSPNYLRSLFKESMGQTILEYVTDYRMLKACEFLKDKTRKVKEIAGQVGYDNVSYFSSVFIKKYGVTPNEYRKMV